MIFSSFSIFNIFIFIKFFLSLSLSLSIFFYLVINIYQRIRDRGKKINEQLRIDCFNAIVDFRGVLRILMENYKYFFCFQYFHLFYIFLHHFLLVLSICFSFFFELFINGINENCNKIRVQSISDWVLVIFYYIFFISCYD